MYVLDTPFVENENGERITRNNGIVDPVMLQSRQKLPYSDPSILREDVRNWKCYDDGICGFKRAGYNNK